MPTEAFLSNTDTAPAASASGARHLPVHGEQQLVRARLDLVLCFQVRHGFRALPVNCQNDVSWAQVCQGCFTSRVNLGRKTRNGYLKERSL